MRKYYETYAYANDTRLTVEATSEGIYLGIFDGENSKTFRSLDLDTEDLDDLIPTKEINQSKYANSILAKKVKIFDELEELLYSKNLEYFLDPNKKIFKYIEDFESDFLPELLEIINANRHSNPIKHEYGFWYTKDFDNSKLFSVLDKYNDIFEKKYIYIDNKDDKYLFVSGEDLNYDHYYESLVESLDSIASLNDTEELSDYRFKLTKKVANDEIKISFATEELKNDFVFHMMELFEGLPYTDYINGTDFNKNICYAPIGKNVEINKTEKKPVF